MASSIQRRKVREVARIRGFGDLNPVKPPCISVQKLQDKSSGSDRVLISFSAEQTTSSKPFNYEVDHCYDREAGNDMIFSEEIKPLISSVFEGKSATVFAYGSRGSGKTYTIQGSENVPGLISLSMSEFLSRAEEVGNSISISLYEVLQDHVFDLLDSKKPEISVLEGANGKIVLKGLSKATIKTMSDFQKLWFAILQRPLQKMPNEPPQRSHRGMIIGVSSSLNDTSLLGRMNLVDLAGYEDKRQSVNGASLLGISKINKSLYAIHNVLHALRSNETRAPYRESKLTRMLQESLGGMNSILMITCMDPTFSEDTIKTLSLASRSCQGVNKTKFDHTSKIRSLIKPTMTPTSSSKQAVAHSSNLVKVASFSVSTRKQVTSLFRSIERKPQDVKVQGRRLFEELQSDNAKKEMISRKNTEVTASSRKQEEKMSMKKMEVTKSSSEQEEMISKKNMEVTESFNEQEENMSEHDMEVTESPIEQEENMCAVNATQLSPVVCADEEQRDIVKNTTDTQKDNLVSEETLDNLQPDKENKSTALSEVASPPLSARLQELSNNLKSLYNSTPLNIKTEIENYKSIKGNDKLGNEVLEPSTPMSLPTVNASSKPQFTNLMSPWEQLQVRSTGMKDSLVHECLTFLNSASKEELKCLKGVGEARANYILELRDESPLKSLDDLKEVGLSSKQINGMMQKVAGGLLFD